MESLIAVEWVFTLLCFTGSGPGSHRGVWPTLPPAAKPGQCLWCHGGRGWKVWDLWILIAPFWLSTDNMLILHGVPNSWWIISFTLLCFTGFGPGSHRGVWPTLPPAAEPGQCLWSHGGRGWKVWDLWILIAPFWLSTDHMLIVHGVSVPNSWWIISLHPPVFYRFWTRVASWSLTNPTSCCRARPVSLVSWWKGLESLRSLNIDCTFLALNWPYVDCTWSP